MRDFRGSVMAIFNSRDFRGSVMAIFNSDLAKPIQSYSRYQPGISEKTITGMTQNQIVCK
jgi:hypothetical protein